MFNNIRGYKIDLLSDNEAEERINGLIIGYRWDKAENTISPAHSDERKIAMSYYKTWKGKIE